ncbi:hypothetical protein CERZMDRAFT_80549 [Cercospora zeae-maydis SCOH1-5]|uniref:Uncharacterized protein n=1 Tax=Cercospora zeae-maydis SCOH1-5 TaxID=717836 RepID=A0A6A6FXG0_9PEZI|nr:hypothetical protein CERZMDRAFT_80549 [Cercospora zeae-maydis SCOH1-5]
MIVFEGAAGVKGRIRTPEPAPVGLPKEYSATNVPLGANSCNDLSIYYPIAGTSEHANVLPHISFNDPFLPWARTVLSAGDDESFRKTPWLALLSFDAGEVQLRPAHNEAIAGVAAARTAGANSAAGNTRDPLAPSSTGALSLTVAELLDVRSKGAVQVPLTDAIAKEERLQAETVLRAIIVTRNLATTSLGDANETATLWTVPADGALSTKRYGLLAHVRQINSTGTHAPTAKGSDQDLVSTVICHRLGPTELQAPKKMAVHVVSLDHLNELNLQSSAEAYALLSLYSWTYWCVPDTHVRFQDSMKALATTISPLAYTAEQIRESFGPSMDSPEKIWLKSRLESGCTFIRSIMQTGEMTAAIARGLFSPLRPAEWSRGPSNDGNSLQIWIERAA